MQIATLCYPTSRRNASERTSLDFKMLHNWDYLTRVLGSIRARFVELGYLDDDIDELRRHHEVNNSKPMSDRGAPDSSPKLSRLTQRI
jgi:hypothetical protein